MYVCKQGPSEHTYGAVWTALKAWLTSQYDASRGGSIQTFAKVTWQHASAHSRSTLVLSSADHKPMHPHEDMVTSNAEHATACSAPSLSTMLLPVFVLANSYMKAHMLMPCGGVTRAATLAGTQLQPTEELNHTKVALR